MSEQPLIHQRDPTWKILTEDVTCANCGKTITAGSMARRTRGLERHMGMWWGTCCR